MQAEYQLGLILLEHLLQELQQRVDNAAAAAAAATARGGAATGVPLPSLPTTLEVTKEEEGDEAGAGGLGAQEGAEGGEGGADGAEDADAAGSAGRFANEDKLTQLRMEYGPRVNGERGALLASLPPCCLPAAACAHLLSGAPVVVWAACLRARSQAAKRQGGARAADARRRPVQVRAPGKGRLRACVRAMARCFTLHVPPRECLAAAGHSGARTTSASGRGTSARPSSSTTPPPSRCGP